MPAQLLVASSFSTSFFFYFEDPVAEAQSQSWLFEMPSARAFCSAWTLDISTAFRGPPCQSLPLDFIAVMFVSTLSVLLNITSIEISTKREAALDQSSKCKAASTFCARPRG